MLRIRRILVATDFSECGDSAIPRAVRLARVHGAELHLLHAVAEWRFDSLFQLHDSTDREAMQRVLRYRAEYRLRDRASRLPVSAELQVVERSQHASGAIVAFAEERGVDLIVMATHGRGGFRRHLLGSVTHEVLRRATCPVMTVKPVPADHEEETSFGSILVPVDFSWCSRLALAYAQELAGAHGASLQLLHVISEATRPDSYLMGSHLSQESRRAMEVEAERRLRELAGEASEKVPDTRAFVRFGRPAGEIIRFARGSGADLILMARHGLGGLLKVMLGSVTAHVVHAAPCSVLVTNWGRRLVPDLRVQSSHYGEVTPGREPSGTDRLRVGTKTAT